MQQMQLNFLTPLAVMVLPNWKFLNENQLIEKVEFLMHLLFVKLQ